SAVTAAASVGRLLYTLPGDLAAGEYTLRFGASGLSVTGAVFTVTNVQKAVKPWTILIYFDADNNLEASQMLDFLDIAKVGSTSNINVLVQMDRTPAYYIGYDNWYGAKRFYMTNGITPVIACALQDLGEVSMARPGTLTDFINWGVENYPASRYLLVMADHGNGWPGALWEDTPNALYNVPQPMTMFQQVLSNAVAPMTIVGYDCCNMAAIEAAYQLRNSGAGIYIGSQYMETKGWAYAEILQELEKTGGQMDTRALASRICDLSVSIYRPQDAATQTAVDLGKMQSLAEALTGFTSMMITNTEDRTRIREKADGVASNYYKAIVHHAANQQTERLTTGLNINFPNSEEHNIGGNYVSAVLDFKADANWLAFLQAYSNSLAVTWIGDARSRMGEGDDLDLMRFVNAIRPPDDTLWASFSLTGRGNLIGVPNNENLQFHRGETIQIVGQGEPAEQGGMNPRPATHFVRWWASDGVTFSNELTEATNWVTFAGNAVIIAYFSDNQSEYKVTYSPVGGGTLNGQRDAFELMVHHGSNAPAVSAVADAGCSFSGWGGDVNEHANPLVISNVISDLSILGLFWEVPEAWSNNTDTSWWHAGVTNFTLNTPQQLAGLAQIVNQGTDTFSGKTVMLGTNLDLAGKAWTPIGSSGHPYSGSANGAGFAINGLTIQKTAADDHQGLFGLVHSTGSIAIENLYLTNTDIVAGGFVGGLAGQVESVEGSILVRNCSNAGSVWGYGSLVGGLVGELTTGADVGAVTVSNCLNSARVNGASDAGGVAGRVLAQGDAIIANCSNEGALTAGGIEIGGVVGAVLSTKLSVTMDRCLNAGPVTAAADYVGGIVGQTQGGDVIVNGCQNSGNIVVTGAGHQYAGGVAGLTSASMPTFVNCINGGDVHGQNYVGGVAGMVPVSIKNCSNEGLVEGADRVGGVAGAVQGSGGVASVDNCMNSGQVTGSGRVGGIAGQIACDNASAASGDYFLKTDSVNTGLSYAGEMVPSTNLPDCATFASLTGVLSTNGYGNKTILVNALNAWVGENSGSYYWRTNRNATLVYPYPDPSLTEAVVTFSANGGIFTGGFNSSNKVYTLRQPYGSLADKPSKTNRAFVGWWYTPEPGVDSAKLVVDMTAVPSVTEVDAWWSTTIFAQTPFPAAVERMAEYYPAVATMTEAQINALANSLAANGRDKVWELIFLGLAPTNPAADPGAVFIYLTVSPVTIHTVPEKPIKTIPAYIVQGKELITDSSWTNIGQPGDSIPDQYRFFRVIEGSGK
ncbi:MAG: clostripain-related cysteine peptidase, partial [bacterium]